MKTSKKGLEEKRTKMKVMSNKEKKKKKKGKGEKKIENKVFFLPLKARYFILFCFLLTNLENENFDFILCRIKKLFGIFTFFFYEKKIYVVFFSCVRYNRKRK